MAVDKKAEKAQKRADRRKAMRAAVKVTLVPAIKGLGFRVGKPPFAVPLGVSVPGPFYQRTRGDELDELNIQWDGYGDASFVINFWTSQTERMLNPDPNFSSSWVTDYARLYARNIPWLGPFGRSESFGGRCPPDKAMAIAQKRLAEWESYLQTGQPDRHIARWDKFIVVGRPSWVS